MRRFLIVALSWFALWCVAVVALTVFVGVVDPDSIDPGDLQGMFLVFGSMGVLGGIAFAALASALEHGPPSSWPLPRTLASGALATAAVQVPYLGHGDAGLAANLLMALQVTIAGVVITALWWLLARKRRPAQAPSHP